MISVYLLLDFAHIPEVTKNIIPIRSLGLVVFWSFWGEIVDFYNLRGGKERIFDDMNNGFGWNRLPKSFMADNTVPSS